MSLKLKTILGVALIEAVLLTILIVTVASYMRDSAGSAVIKRAQTTSTLFATTAKDPVISYDLGSLDSFTADLLSNPDLVYVRVLDADGREFSSAGEKEILARPFREDLTLDSVDDGILDYSALIEEEGIVFGRVELGIDIESVESVIAESRRLSIVIASIEMVLVALFSYLLGTYLTRHLWVLRRSAKKIAEGDYTVEIPVQSADELAEVSRAFNKMTTAIRESVRQRDLIDAELMEVNQ
nr:HAMP domain-containing protein [Granulosicoccus sp.]